MSFKPVKLDKIDSIKHSKQKEKVYRCCDCREKYKALGYLYNHILSEHKNNIPEGQSVEQYYFNRRRGVTHGPLCTICKKNHTPWNPKTSKYHRYCSAECKAKAGELFRINYKKKHGKDHTLKDPEVQKKMLNNRKISGEYKFKCGNTIAYNSSYEADFLAYFERTLGYTFKDIEQCPHTFWYKWVDPDTKEEKDLFYMPDFYMEAFNLIIEIKEGGDNPNKHPKIQRIDKSKELAKDAAIIASQAYNYIKIVNKEYKDFVDILDQIKEKQKCENDDGKKIISIPETVHNCKLSGIIKAMDHSITMDKINGFSVVKCDISNLFKNT